MDGGPGFPVTGYPFLVLKGDWWLPIGIFPRADCLWRGLCSLRKGLWSARIGRGSLQVENSVCLIVYVLC